MKSFGKLSTSYLNLTLIFGILADFLNFFSQLTIDLRIFTLKLNFFEQIRFVFYILQV